MIKITDWQKGVAASPYVGFGKMVGMDIFRRPGVIQNGVKAVQNSYTFTGNITAEVATTDGTGNLVRFIGTSDGKLYIFNTTYPSGNLIQSGLGVVHDLVIFQNYVIISKNGTTLDLYGDITGTPSYVSNWKTGLNASTFGWKKMVVGQDNVLYVANEGALASQTGLFPTVSPTPSAIAIASCLSTGLPTGRIVQTICELNRYIVIVTSLGKGLTGKTRVYYMDRGTPDPTKTSFSLSLGVDIPERKINQIINVNNRLYLFGNDTGTFYTTNSTTYQAIAIIPERILGQMYTTYPNAVCLLNNEILFGIGLNQIYSGKSMQGVYSLRDTSVVTKCLVSTVDYDIGALNIGALCVTGLDTFDIGYSDLVSGLTVYLLDTVSTYLATSYQCWVESPMYETGTSLIPMAFQIIQVNLGNDFQSGQQIQVSYRTAPNQSYSSPVTYSFNTYGAVNSFNAKFSTENTTNIQLKVAFDSGINAVSGQEIQLQEIILQ